MVEGNKKKLLVLLITLVLYLAFGAVIFKAIESSEYQNKYQKKLVDIYAELKSRENLTWNEFQLLSQKLRSILKIPSDSTWTFYSSLYFCGSVVTTIGYGHMTPKTPAGRVIVMFYAIIGIPLNLWTLKVMGDTITSLLTKIISNTEKKLFQKHDEKRLKLKVVAAMATINITMLLLGGAMYKWSENWSFLEGVYYCFIVYSTIGFGDLVPSEGHTVGKTDSNIVMMFVRAFNLIIGLSLLSSLLSSIIQAADDLKVVFPKVKIHPIFNNNRIIVINKEDNIKGSNRTAATDEERKESDEPADETRDINEPRPDQPHSNEPQLINGKEDEEKPS